jgi:hypothetical protein
MQCGATKSARETSKTSSETPLSKALDRLERAEAESARSIRGTLLRCVVFICATVILCTALAMCGGSAGAHGSGHRPDDNECRHQCHHRLIWLAKLCHDAYGKKQPDLDACLNWSVKKWAECVNGCPQ